MMKKLLVVTITALLLPGLALLIPSQSPAQTVPLGGPASPTIVVSDRWPPKAGDMISEVITGVSIPVGGRVKLMTVPSDKYLVVSAIQSQLTAIASGPGDIRFREVLGSVDTLKTMWGEHSFGYAFDGAGIVFRPGADVVIDNTPNTYAGAVGMPFNGDIRVMGYLCKK